MGNAPPKRRAEKIGKEKRTRVTIRINRMFWDAFVYTCEQLGLRRDTYLNLALRGQYVKYLQDLPSGTYGELSRQYNSRAPDTTTLAKLWVDTDLAEQITELCKQKDYSRNLFFERTISEITDLIDTGVLTVLDPGIDPPVWRNPLLNFPDIKSEND